MIHLNLEHSGAVQPTGYCETCLQWNNRDLQFNKSLLPLSQRSYTAVKNARKGKIIP